MVVHEGMCSKLAQNSLIDNFEPTQWIAYKKRQLRSVLIYKKNFRVWVVFVAIHEVEKLVVTFISLSQAASLLLRLLEEEVVRSNYFYYWEKSRRKSKTKSKKM